MPRALRFIGLLLINVAVAVIGTSILDTTIGSAIRPHSLGGILRKEWILSIGCATAIGFGVRRMWRSNVALWTWVLPSVWFAMKLLLVLSTSYLLTNRGSLRFYVSGLACVEGVLEIRCINWSVLAIPLVQSIFYSLGAYLSSTVYAVGHSGDVKTAHGC